MVLVLALVQHGQVQVKVELDCQRQEESVQHGHEPGHDQRQRQCRLRRLGTVENCPRRGKLSLLQPRLAQVQRASLRG